MKKIVFTDVDGTLINYQAHTPDSVKVAVKKLRENGILVFMCTGCSKHELSNRDLPQVDGLIGGNGCYVEYNNEVLFHKTLTLEQCIHFKTWCESRNLAYRLECNDGIFVSDDYVEKSYNARMKYRFGDKKPDGKPFEDPSWKHDNLERDDVNKTAFVLSSYQDYLDAKEEFKDMVVGTWGGKGELALYGDTSPLGVNKGNAVNIVLEHFGFTKEEAIAFGDADSDLPMFQACGFTVALGSGGDHIKSLADYVTDGVDEDGWYNACVKLGLIKK